MDDEQVPAQPTDPTSRVRDHLANERTFLAWLRTGATVMVLGLAVAQLLEPGDRSATVAGMLLVGAGAVAVVHGGLRFRRVHRGLESGRFAGPEAVRGPLVAAVLLMVAVGAALILLLL
ncbi:MAG: DUF202 domain-containing protein [Miltoncostaeaceae bacterium]